MSSQNFHVVLRRKVMRVLSQNYGKILKKLLQQLSEKTWDTMLILVLLITWGTIFAGTFLLLS